ncbi:biopolymer transporter ExbD [Leptospira idonii]|uniref:Biopolymer transporter ExbD n=1 Tax=Leptospira idonii TaxID=1193500 RepID=A0A4R9LZ21_9LEPT|nr:biopolymer transporter ExbD [Leptospira idonii]TGN19590.1 biopolymer transporter ExbD [Leptospira idonii]
MKVRRRRKNKQIEISSLIDILFILLIFLMLSVRFTETRSYLELDLPDSRLSQVGDFESVVTISSDSQGIWYWNGKPESKDSVLSKIESFSEKEKQTKIILDLDKKSEFGHFFLITEKLKEKKINQVEIATKLKR